MVHYTSLAQDYLLFLKHPLHFLVYLCVHITLPSVTNLTQQEMSTKSYISAQPPDSPINRCAVYPFPQPPNLPRIFTVLFHNYIDLTYSYLYISLF